MAVLRSGNSNEMNSTLRTKRVKKNVKLTAKKGSKNKKEKRRALALKQVDQSKTPLVPPSVCGALGEACSDIIKENINAPLEMVDQSETPLVPPSVCGALGEACSDIIKENINAPLEMVDQSKTPLVPPSVCGALGEACSDIIKENINSPLEMVDQSKTHLVPPRVCEALGNSSYSYPARAYPPYCVWDFPPVSTKVCEPLLPSVGVPDPPLNGSEASSSQPDVVAQGPLAHGNVDHALPSEGSTVQGVSTGEVRVAAPFLQFPVVLMRELHRNSRGSDILQFFHGLSIVDMLLVYENESFTGDAFVVFSKTNCADSALKKDGNKLRSKAVRVLPCSKEDYYNAVASSLNVKFDSGDSLANPTDPSHFINNLMGQPLISNSMVTADMSYPLGQSTCLCENIMDHGRSEPEAKNILDKDDNCHNGVDGVKESNKEPNLPDGHLQVKQQKTEDEQKGLTKVLRMNNLPPSADKYDIIELFGEYQLLPENLHCDCKPNGMATGVVYVEFNSVEDANKALSKNMSKINSQVVDISISSKEQAMQALNGKW